MRLSKTIRQTKFTVEVLKEATETLFKDIQEERRYHLNVGVSEGCWTHEDLDEFFADYRRSEGNNGVYQVEARGHALRVQFLDDKSVLIAADAPNRDRPRILATLDVFDRNKDACAVPLPVAKRNPVIFIGHGRSGLWRDLKDHLSDKHDYETVAFESGDRAGHTVRDILHSMMTKSSFALLVMTGEDETKAGELRARQNVVHEVGLFQGKLGFERAIVLLEDECGEFSNIQGITQIRFSKGNIRETFGDVLATLRREFPPNE